MRCRITLNVSCIRTSSGSGSGSGSGLENGCQLPLQIRFRIERSGRHGRRLELLKKGSTDGERNLQEREGRGTAGIPDLCHSMARWQGVDVISRDGVSKVYKFNS